MASSQHCGLEARKQLEFLFVKLESKLNSERREQHVGDLESLAQNVQLSL